MDYMYTAFHQAHTDGTPVLHPLWFKYPKDTATFPIDLQFLYGDSILVSPVTNEDSTSVSIYLPKDIFYDFDTLTPVYGQGSSVVLNDISYTQIPLHIRGGAVLPLRVKSAMTTTALRQTDFEFVVAPDTDGKASGRLYVDDGESITPASATVVRMDFEKGMLSVKGEFAFRTGVNAARVRFLGVLSSPTKVLVNGRAVSRGSYVYDGNSKVLDVTVGLAFNGDFSVQFS
jgi:alpha-glucosidase